MCFSLIGSGCGRTYTVLPHNETIHIENPFVKTHIADAEVQGDMPEGTKLDTVIDITVTVNNAGLCCASGTIKLGEQTFEINDVTASADGYTLSKKTTAVPLPHCIGTEMTRRIHQL